MINGWKPISNGWAPISILQCRGLCFLARRARLPIPDLFNHPANPPLVPLVEALTPLLDGAGAWLQEAGAFKPDKRTYAKAEEIIATKFEDIERSNILFVANHAFDCIGAKAWGFRTVFIDRRKRPFGESPYQPDLIVKDFTELETILI